VARTILLYDDRSDPGGIRDVAPEAGLLVVTISQWLGHASVTTTNRYATIDLEMKRKAIERAQAIDRATSGELTLWRTDASILTWLGAL
jgi:integrase